MQVLVVVPALLTVLFAAWRGARHAFVFVLLPALLLLPNYYTWKLPGIPVLSFHDYAVAAALLAFCCGRDRVLWRPHALDLVVAAYWGWIVASEYSAKGYEDAQNLAALRGLAIVAPYLLGRCCVERDGLLVGTVAMLAIGGALVGLASPYEARLGVNPFDFWRSLWPESVPWDGVVYRNGLRRVAGPFAHPICQGFYFQLVLPLVWWLLQNGWPRARAWRWLVGGGCVLGLLATMSRGPILGAGLALAVTGVGWLRSRSLVALLGLAVGTLGALWVAEDAIAYVSITRGEARTPEQETAAYRNEMLDNYLEVVAEAPWLGFGKDAFPVVKGQKSIDNQYLLLSLSHGVPAAVLFLLAMLLPALRLFRALLRRAHDEPLARFGFALLGSLLGAIATQVTVFAGTQTVEILFLLVGAAVGVAGRLGRRSMP